MALRCDIDQNNKKLFFYLMSNLQTYYHFKLDFQKVDQNAGASGWPMAPNVARTSSCKAWNSPVEYPSRECKHDIKKWYAIAIHYHNDKK